MELNFLKVQMFPIVTQSGCRKSYDRAVVTPEAGPPLLLIWINFNPSMDHDDVIKWKHFPRCWPFVRGIHWSPENSSHKGQWRGALMFSLIHAWINGWVNNREAGDLRRHRAHHDVIVIISNTFYMRCWMKLLIHSQTAPAHPFGNGYVISPHILLGIWLLSHAGIKINPCKEKFPSWRAVFLWSCHVFLRVDRHKWQFNSLRPSNAYMRQ